jgi:hypothetical protein
MFFPLLVIEIESVATSSYCDPEQLGPPHQFQYGPVVCGEIVTQKLNFDGGQAFLTAGLRATAWMLTA